MKWTVGAVVLFALILALAGTASAHVTVSPNETTQGAYEVFTVRVPTELESETTKVELLFPDGVAISRVQPLSGWSYVYGNDSNGAKTSIVWTAEGAGLKDGEFAEFKLQGKVGDDAQELVWKAVQTYANGTVVEWAGGAEAETPASVTKVLPGTGEADHHGAAVAQQEHEEHVSVESGGGSNDINDSLLRSSAFYISLAALLIGVIALLLTQRSRGSKHTAS
ncbi:YcnI family protein [Paenibacillus cellulosilyticus]|uniref:YcnI family copper-binding membrane protein n=1 Tax=Paenibacillus cellulosilyticus TaxID=375489 RepID=UPI001FE7720B|nr:YcnI family protein [Paenibacillus cellulosilyticus]